MKPFVIGSICGVGYLLAVALSTGMFAAESAAYMTSYLGAGILFGGPIGMGVAWVHKRLFPGS
jgi:hypothetical protein